MKASKYRVTTLRPRGTLRVQGALLLAAGALMLPALGLAPLFDVDEGAFSEATREMMSSGDWLSTTLNGAPRFDKPILIYWLQAMSAGLFGLNEFALRLPSAVAGLAWIVAIFRFLAPRAGTGAGALAAWICATSLGVTVICHAATADALLNALLAAAMLDAWRFIESREGGRPAAEVPDTVPDAGRRDTGRWPLLRMYLWIGLGFLTKGPIAALIPVAATFLYALSVRRLDLWRRAALHPAGWAILLAVAAPWYVYQFAHQGRAFYEGFFLKHNVQRFSGTLEGHSGSLVYYVGFIPLMLLPWSGLLAPAVRAARADWREPLARYLWLWFAFVFVFFSLSGTKLWHYVLYGLTPLFLLMALHRDSLGSGPVSLLSRALAAAMLLLMPLLPWLVHRWADAASGPRTAYYVALAQHAVPATPLAFFAITAACAAVGVAALFALRAPGWARLAVAAAALSLSLHAAVAPWLGDMISGPVKRAALFARNRPEHAVQWNINVPSFSLYRGEVTPSRDPRLGEIAITRADRFESYPHRHDVERLFEEGGILIIKPVQ